MDFELSPEQEMLRRTAREFFAAEWSVARARELIGQERGCPEELWRKMADWGWMALAFPEQYDGVGGGLADLTVLLEEMGRVNAPGLFFTSVVLGGRAVLEAGSEEQKARLLPAIASGDVVVTLAAQEATMGQGCRGVRATALPDGEGYALQGTALFVPDANAADYLVCAARTADRRGETGGMGLFLIRTGEGSVAGLSLRRLRTMAGDKQFEVDFDGVMVGPEGMLGGVERGEAALRRVLEIAAVGKGAEMIGGAQRVLELAVEQGQNRSQFGRPIGSFQAIQHHCANMSVDVELGRFLTYQAAWLLDQGMGCSKQVSMAKAFVGEAYLRVMTLGHEVLGGNGLIEEHEMPLFSARGPAGQQLFGSPDYHREVVVRELGF